MHEGRLIDVDVRDPGTDVPYVPPDRPLPGTTALVISVLRLSVGALAMRRRAWLRPDLHGSALWLPLALALTPLHAAVAATDAGASAAAPAQRPKVALVLSGGGARGGAHVGVLKVLEELRIPVDFVVGTSAGAIVGAAYASGMSPSAIEHELGQLRTANLFHDLARGDVPLRRKADDETNFIGPEIGIGSQGIQLPKGAIAGVSLEAVLRRLTAGQRDGDFDRLPIPFRAIATDVTTGEMVVLKQGSLSTAVRASMAIPAAVDPVQIDGRLLVDGGVVRNLPVDVARSLGADVVIAVNIGTPLLKREEIVSLLSVAAQMAGMLTAGNVRQSLSEIRAGDVLITPDLGQVTTADFDHLPEAVAAGEGAARAAVASLDRLSLDGASYGRLAAARQPAWDGASATRIDDVRVAGASSASVEVIRATMDSQPGQTLDAATIDRDLKRIYGRGDFEHVGYRMAPEPGVGNVLTVDVAEKSWGPQYLRFGLGLSTDFSGSAYFTALASHRATWLNTLGAEWRNDVQIGGTDRLRTEWYQPLSAAQRWFASAWAEHSREPFDVFDQGRRLVRLRLKQTLAGVDVGVPLQTYGEVRLGAYSGHTRFANDVSVLANTDLPADGAGGLSAQLRLDTLDSLRFPRSGYAARVRLDRSLPALGAASGYSKYTAEFRTAMSAGRHTLRVGISGAGALGSTSSLPLHELSSLGGFLKLSGYRTGEFIGRDMRFGRLVYTYQLTNAGFLEGSFVGLSAEAGRVGDSVTGANTASTRHGNAIFLGVDTPLGPLYLGYGRAGAHAQAVYLFLGQP